MSNSEANGQRGIQSVEVGGRLLVALAHEGRPLPLKDLARDAGMSAAKAHPYLVSFGKLGLVEQDRLSGHYGLGPLALQLGLMSLQQADPLRIAEAGLAALAHDSGHTAAIAVWGNRGPTIVRIAESPAAVHVNMRQGTVYSIPGTASGRLFAALLPEADVRPLYDAERRTLRTLPAWRSFAPELAEVRERGLARVEGGVVPGVSALSAPVLDHRGDVVLALTLIGPSAALDVRWSGPAAVGLVRAARAVSARLGHRADGRDSSAPVAPRAARRAS